MVIGNGCPETFPKRCNVCQDPKTMPTDQELLVGIDVIMFEKGSNKIECYVLAFV